MSYRRSTIILSAAILLCGTPLYAAKPAKGTPPRAEGNYAAKVNGAIISKKDVDLVLKNNPTLTDNKQNRRAIVEELVARELVIQAAKEKRLEQNSDVKAAIESSERQILFAAGADSYLKEKPIRDFQVREQYDVWIKNFPKEEYKIRRILLKTQEEAERIVERIRDGKSFADLALQSLDADSAKKGGEIGWIAPMSPATAQQLANLKIGKASDPIEAPNGWEIVEVMEKRPSQPPEFDQIKDRFRAAMQQELLRRYVQELREKASIVFPQD